jgi:hypothetical protein
MDAWADHGLQDVGVHITNQCVSLWTLCGPQATIGPQLGAQIVPSQDHARGHQDVPCKPQVGLTAYIW